MAQQKVVRTYPDSFTNPTLALREALKDGWKVVMSSPFDCRGKQGTEYIVEKE